MNKQPRRFYYLFFDLIASEAVWAAFFIFRKKVLEPQKFGIDIPVKLDANFYIGLLLIPILWLFLYALAGFYSENIRRSRLFELSQSVIFTLLGSLVLFFAVMLDDQVANYTYYYQSFGFYFLLQFFVGYFPRLWLTTLTYKAIQKGLIGFNTLIVGSGTRALELTEELEHELVKNGNRIIGFCTINGKIDSLLADKLTLLGKSSEINRIILENRIEEVIIATETEDNVSVQKVIDSLAEHELTVKAIPDLSDILSGSVKMTSIFGTPLIEISPVVMPEWQQTLKRLFDIGVSLIALLILSPLFLVLAMLIKWQDKGPVFYKQERVGLRGKKFNIIKFRSMFMNAESMGPALSSKNDPRITPVGRILRKYRLDEFPQFINVLEGEMSLVGPRPERQFFIEQIVLKAPHYKLLHRVRPGITSWGMVKYGYAENVDQMIKRMRFDILYLENMSLILDLKILIYTALTVIKGRGL